MKTSTDQIYFSGDYQRWTEASERATGYDAKNIVEKALDAALKVQRGEAVAQRNGVIFDKIPYNFQLLTALLCAAIHDENRLRVLDFGGSLGSSYFHSRDFLDIVSSVHWSIIEQPNFVLAGRTHLKCAELDFYESVEECGPDYRPNLIIVSGVLAYMPTPYETLETLLNLGASHLFFDRTGLIASNSDRLTIQHVPESAYEATIPAWFLSEARFLSSIRKAAYRLLCEFPAIDNYSLPGASVSFKGFIFRKN